MKKTQPKPSWRSHAHLQASWNPAVALALYAKLEHPVRLFGFMRKSHGNDLRAGGGGRKVV